MWGSVTFDSTRIGTAAAVWNEGQPDEYRYSAEVDGTDPDAITRCAADANAARDAWLAAEQAKQAAQPAIVQALTDALNGGVVDAKTLGAALTTAGIAQTVQAG